MRYLGIKPGSLEEVIKKTDEDYQALFKKQLKATGKSIPQMTPDEKKAFFTKIDKMHAAKNEGNVDELTSAQKKLGLEKYDSDKTFGGKGTPEQRLQLLKLTTKALKTFPSSPKQKEIQKDINALRKKMGMKFKEEQIDEVNLTFIRKFADDMKKDKQFKPFADKFMKMAMKGGSPRDALEKSLPDYIAGKDIEKLIDKNRMSAVFGESLNEQGRNQYIAVYRKTPQSKAKIVALGTQPDKLRARDYAKAHFNASPSQITVKTTNVDLFTYKSIVKRPGNYFKGRDTFLGGVDPKDLSVIDNAREEYMPEDMTPTGKNKVAQLKTKLAKEKDSDKLMAQITDLKGQLALAKQQLENEKNAKLAPEPNPDTGEVPLTVGIAYKHLKDKMKKEQEKKKTMVGTKPSKVDTTPEAEFDK